MKSSGSITRLAVILVMLVLSMIAFDVSPGATVRAQTLSAANSQPSATPADDAALRRACAEAVDELKAARKLLEKQDIEIKLQAEMLDLEQKINAGLKDLRTLDEAEKLSLRDAIAAKDRVIASQEAAIAALKKNRWTFWKNAKAVTLGVAAGIVIGAIVLNK